MIDLADKISWVNDEWIMLEDMKMLMCFVLFNEMYESNEKLFIKQWLFIIM